MTETTVAIVRPPDARSKPSSHRARPAGPATVSASALALHFDCSRAYLTKLESEGVLHRDGGGFDLDAIARRLHPTPAARAAAIAAAEADAAFQRAKTGMLELEIGKQRTRLDEDRRGVGHGSTTLIGQFRTGCIRFRRGSRAAICKCVVTSSATATKSSTASATKRTGEAAEHGARTRDHGE